MLPIAGVPVIGHVVERATRAGYRTVVAMPVNGCAPILTDYVTLQTTADATMTDIVAEADVLGRFMWWVQDTSPDYIVRLTADCPFIDPDLIRTVTEATMAGGYEYGDNITFRTYPRGLDVQVYRRDYLQWLHETAETPADREHVLPRIRDKGSRYVHVNPEGNTSQHRWCLDDARDLAFFERIAEHLDCTPPRPTTRELLTFLEAHPEYVHTDYPAAA